MAYFQSSVSRIASSVVGRVTVRCCRPFSAAGSKKQKTVDFWCTSIPIYHSVFPLFEITKPVRTTKLGRLSRPRGHAHSFSGFGSSRIGSGAAGGTLNANETLISREDPCCLGNAMRYENRKAVGLFSEQRVRDRNLAQGGRPSPVQPGWSRRRWRRLGFRWVIADETEPSPSNACFPPIGAVRAWSGSGS